MYNSEHLNCNRASASGRIFELLELKQHCEQKTLFDSINVIRPEQCHTVSAHTSRILYSNDIMYSSVFRDAEADRWMGASIT